MELRVDIGRLPERQAEVPPKHSEVHDFSGLVAAADRHRVGTPRVGTAVDGSWRAAALTHTVVRPRPLPARDTLRAAARAFTDAAGAAVAPPRGALAGPARDIDAGHAVAYDAADRIRPWRD